MAPAHIDILSHLTYNKRMKNLLEIKKITKHKLLTFRLTAEDFTRTLSLTKQLECKRSDLLREILSRGLESVEGEMVRMHKK